MTDDRPSHNQATPVIVVVSGLTGGVSHSANQAKARDLIMVQDHTNHTSGQSLAGLVLPLMLEVWDIAQWSSTSEDVCSQVHPFTSCPTHFTGAGVPITSPQLYSAGHTDDFRQSLVYISHLFPEAPLLGIGFSMGANMMTRYVAEEGEKSRLRSCCSLSSVSRSCLSKKKNSSKRPSHGILLRIIGCKYR